ncbi:MAG TPA: hypothetical protein VD794_12635 [Flavisolibacter sp.]|nr:hypothetical protein [Flavisolibacter sp.]
MRATAVFLFIFLSVNASSQPSVTKYLDSTLFQLKAQNQTDKTDSKVFSLLESFYNEALQADQGELSLETAQKINAYVSDNSLKNKHLLILFLIYQDHISQTAARGLQPNTEFQVACMNLLESEMKLVYNKVPTIVYVYKVEALKSAGRKEEASAFVEASLNVNPTSIPLKVYKYLGSHDESIKADLVENHSKHWMVQLYKIK